jgi:hypothetical protein
MPCVSESVVVCEKIGLILGSKVMGMEVLVENSLDTIIQERALLL